MPTPTIGVRELKNEASEIIRAVREEQARYVVTFRGRPVAFITPVRPEALSDEEARLFAAADDPLAAYWQDLDHLAARIDAAWSGDDDAVDLVDAQRR